MSFSVSLHNVNDLSPKRAASADDAPVTPLSKRAISHYQLIAPSLRDVLPDIFAYAAASHGDLFLAMLVCRDWAVAAGAAAFRHTHSTMWHPITANFTPMEFANSRSAKILVGDGPRP